MLQARPRLPDLLDQAGITAQRGPADLPDLPIALFIPREPMKSMLGFVLLLLGLILLLTAPITLWANRTTVEADHAGNQMTAPQARANQQAMIIAAAIQAALGIALAAYSSRRMLCQVHLLAGPGRLLLRRTAWRAVSIIPLDPSDPLRIIDDLGPREPTRLVRVRRLDGTEVDLLTCPPATAQCLADYLRDAVSRSPSTNVYSASPADSPAGQSIPERAQNA